MVETQASHGPRMGRWLLAAATGAMLLVGLVAAFRAQPAAAAATTLRAAADAKGIKIGSAFAANHLSADPTYASIGAAQFNSVSPENEMKWGSVEPSMGNFTFGPADQVVAFARANNMRIRMLLARANATTWSAGTRARSRSGTWSTSRSTVTAHLCPTSSR